MPKIKSHSGAKKRIRKTGSGRLAFKRRGRNHLLQQKNKRQKRLDRTVVMHPRDTGRHEQLVPYL
ncbi:MAG: large subunit ribosomal protein L35 [Candidatus Peregrinibacteria bacterium Greene0416_19]|nr:MAG: large subunit ribosomal protein L35 [Candidatus Peregrinibacteria bacterium Greene0416_19]